MIKIKEVLAKLPSLNFSEVDTDKVHKLLSLRILISLVK